MSGTRRRAGWPALFLVILCAAVTMTQTSYVGGPTIYSSRLERGRLLVHHALLTNTPPEGGWSVYGAERLTVRASTVHVAEFLSRVTHRDVLKIYRYMDMLFLFLTLLAIPAVLAAEFSPLFALVGVLYMGSVLPLSYALYFFHPWDRPAAFFWLLALWATARDRFVWLAVIIVLAIIVKFDGLFLPILYFLAWGGRGTWVRTGLRTLVLYVPALITFAILCWMFPGGWAHVGVAEQVASNLRDLARMNLHHPAVLMFTLPLALAIVGIRGASRVAVAGLLVALVLLFAMFLFAGFAEVRAQIGALLLLLPAALYGLRRVLALSGFAVAESKGAAAAC